MQRFWDKVEKTDTCWWWRGSRTPKGYGQFCVRHGHMVYAHRLAWEMARGRAVPAGMCILHRCDQRACVNPDHLWVGTVADNQADMKAKGRARTRALPGSQHHNAKITESIVRQIKTDRASGMTLKAVAAKYGVHLSNVWLICRGQAWKHVT